MLSGISVEYSPAWNRQGRRGITRGAGRHRRTSISMKPNVPTSSTWSAPRRPAAPPGVAPARSASARSSSGSSIRCSPSRPTSATAAWTSWRPTSSGRPSTPRSSPPSRRRRTWPFSFLSPQAREFFVSWEAIASDAVAILRPRPEPLRPPPVRPHRRAVHPQRRIPGPLGRPQRQVPPHRQQAAPPSDSRRSHPRLRGPGTARRPRPADPRLHRRARIILRRRPQAARHLVRHHTPRGAPRRRGALSAVPATGPGTGGHRHYRAHGSAEGAARLRSSLA